MKAIVYQKYGGPEVLELKEIEKPKPKENEVLIKVHSTSINPYEWHHMRGKPLFARLSIGFFKPRNQILGMDVAGTVVQAGRKVTHFEIGDLVFGFSNFGGLAEYTCVEEDKLIHKPSNASFEEAASLSIAGITALQSLRDFAKVKPGQKVLINGSSGGVGLFSIQIAKHIGAEVTGVCSSRNIELVKSVGADHVIDYTQQKVAEIGIQYDAIIDNVGNLSIRDYRELLKPGGTCAVVGFTSVSRLFSAMMKSLSRKSNIRLVSIDVTRKDLHYLKDLVESEKLKPIIVRKYPLAQIREAMTYLETGHARAKLVIDIKGEEASKSLQREKKYHKV